MVTIIKASMQYKVFFKVVEHALTLFLNNSMLHLTRVFSDEGIYNTYVLDSDYTSWALLLHCAEKSKVPRYLHP